MSENVDVLAVMRKASVQGLTMSRVGVMEDARDAVAELIEAASYHVNGGEIGAVARKERLLTALARVKGGDA